MALSGWGGGLEIAAFVHLHRRAVHVFEKSSAQLGAYSSVARFDVEGLESADTVYLLYAGRCHYDGLVTGEDASP